MFYILLWRDCIEIFFYSFLIYSFCTWLKTDKTKNLVGYFLGYCFLILACHAAQLQTVTPLLISYAPIALLLFIVLHDKTLQRNFVALRSITPPTKQTLDWLDILLSSTLTFINKNKSVIVVIENKDSLERFVKNSSEINADIGKCMLELLFSSTLYDKEKMIWIDAHGKLRGINVTWLDERNQREDTLLFTTHTDAIVFSINPISRTFTTIHRGKELHNIQAHQIGAIIKKQLSQHMSKNKGVYHASTATEKSDYEQSST